MFTKITAALIAALIIASMLILPTGAIEFAGSNRDIAITPHTYTGYRFFGPDSPHSPIDTTQIASVKFYIKFEDLQNHEPAVVQLAYNSGTTGWVSRNHDLNDGLIVSVSVTGGVSQDDFFEVALSTENDAIHGTYSVELRSRNGAILGEGVYSNNITQADETPDNSGELENELENEGQHAPENEGEDEEQQVPQEQGEGQHAPEAGHEEQQPHETQEVGEPQGQQGGELVNEAEKQPEAGHGNAGNPQTDGSNILTATGMTIVSALAVLSMAKKARREDDE